MSTPIMLSEWVAGEHATASLRDIAASAEAARLAGCRVYTIPADFDRCDDAEGALWHIPLQPQPTPAFWIGFIPTPERYAAIYNAALAKNLLLPNTPAQHRDAQEFDYAYPKLGDLTPQSLILRSTDEAREVAEKIGLPVFVKGAIQSRKSRGWRACVAETVNELEVLTRQLLDLDNRSRGRVVVRKLLRLRHSRMSPGQDFPLGREFRAFVWQGQIVGLGYYWEGEDPLSALTSEEERIVRELALSAARRVGAPYLTVDIGQEEGGRWWVIETGDGQFSGLSQIAPLELWHQISEASQRIG